MICKLCRPKRPAKRKKVVVVHHNDFDGIMGAVALFRLHSSDDFVSISTSRRKVLKNLKKAIRQKPDLLYVVDIGPNDHELEELEGLLRGRTFKLVWMDHHKWSQRALEKIKELADELVYDRSTCGAGLAARYAKERGARLCDCCEELVELSCDIDLWIRKDPRSEKMSIALGNRRWRRFLIDKLWKCVGWDADWEEAYEEALREMEESLQKYLKKAVEGEVDGISYVMVPIKLKDVAHVSFMAEEIRKKRTYDVIAFVSDVGSLHMRRGTERVDLSELAKEFSGGGHPAAAGGNLNYSFIEKIMHKLFLRVNAKKFESGLRAYLEKSNADKGMREAELSQERSGG
ncbi:DHHA1 domain-containing protein [Ignicoccus hospitalis]|uniref:DHHA1 domain-containing protein n=1 Tax=Ignicoccus hospitalis TaxID=160233 RepID=UPI001650807D|nr:DHHA1 domain-containing protein [Ignicoccus hospitalis]HIH90579.1 hypothetical protein [Desulfurococcaceae archaeon]